MKKYILFMAVVTSISIIACRKVEMDGEPFIIEVPGNGNDTTVTGKTVTLSGHVTTDTTLRAIDNNILSGLVYVDAGVTLIKSPPELFNPIEADPDGESGALTEP